MLDFICDYKYELLSLAAIGFGTFYWSSAQNKKGPLASIKWQLIYNTTVVITGANTGIGYETALALAKRGARVVMACRDLEKAKRASERIMAETNNNANVFVEFLDLASLDSVKEFANRLNFNYLNIDLLINNAGIMACPRWITKDGFECQFQVNYLSHYLLTRLLLDKIYQSSSSSPRVINLTSKLYESGKIDWNDINMARNYDPISSYKQSKLCNILFTNELYRYLRERSIDRVEVFSVSPGVVLTELGRYMMSSTMIRRILSTIFYPLLWAFMRSPKQGCECTVYCAIVPDLKPTVGKYFRNCEEIPLLPNATNNADAERLWKLSEELLQKWLNEDIKFY